MNSNNAEPLMLIDAAETSLRLDRVRRMMHEAPSAPQALLIADHANLYYLTGRIFDGWVYLPLEDEPVYFVKRPATLCGDFVVRVRKPEEIGPSIGLGTPSSIGLELDTLPWSAVTRLKNVFPEAALADASWVMRRARAVKTPRQIELMRRSGECQVAVNERIPGLFRPGMTDLELQVEIERVSRLEGCLGIFRIAGPSMEIFMGNVLTGDNADAPSPYDFAMGGAGVEASLPVGAAGTPIRPGDAVMVDMNGNYTGYMTDMTRVFTFGEVSDKARRAHECSLEIHRRLAAAGVPGAKCSELYALAVETAREASLEEYFMGHRQKAGFVGHGVGIEINELPVIAPRSRDILEAGNTVALEPKFVIPGTGAVGIENTYVVTDRGLDNITRAPEGLTPLDA